MNHSIQLCYRGINYQLTASSTKTACAKANGLYRGVAMELDLPCVSHSVLKSQPYPFQLPGSINLTYRGVFYRTLKTT